MTTKDIYSQSEHHMKRSIETLKENLMKIRTGRAHTGLLEHITVDYYGCPTPISQVAQLGLADARTITVQPWEKKMGLMKLFLVSLRREIAALNKANVRVRLVGDLTAFSEELQQQIADSMKITENNTGLMLNVCVNYGGRWEILEAAKRSREVPPEELTEQKFASLLPLADSGDVDLFIRTSGEERISNFMLWQLAYGELYFTKILWPDFTENEFLNALNWYSNRERRFGKTSEQIQQEAKKE